MRVQTDVGQCSATVQFPVTATDNCTVASVVCTPPSGSALPVGNTRVECVATDAAGNRSQCHFSVTVEHEPPVIESLTATPNLLWPPNHQMVAVKLAVS